MVGALLILIGVAGLALGALGRSLLPGLAAAVLAGAVLVATAVVDVVRSWRRREVVARRVVAALALGLALGELPVAFWFVLEAGLGHSAQAHLRLPLKLLGLFAGVVVPTSALLLLRRHQLRAAHSVPGGPPEPVLWDFARGRVAALATALVLALVAGLLPVYGGWPPILLAIRGHSVALTRLCLSLGAELNPAGRRALTPLAVAIEQGDTQLVALLLERGADPNDSGADVPPLTRAVMRGRPVVVRLLLEHGARPDVPSVLGPTLCLAASSGHSEIAGELLAHGADPGQRDTWGCTALAGALGYPTLIQRLVAGGVDPEAPCGVGNVWLPGDTVTPLMIAAAEGYDPAVRALLAAGADCSARSGLGRTPLELAVEHGRDDVVRVLVEHGAGSSSGR